MSDPQTDDERRQYYAVGPGGEAIPVFSQGDLRAAVRRHDDQHRVVMEYLARIEAKVNALREEVASIVARRWSPED